MSNGIGKNPLLDISKVYQEQIATEGTMDIKGFEIPKKDRESAAERIKKKTAEKKAALEKKHGKKMDDHPEYPKKKYVDEKLDPVGQEDGDVNNDGKKDSSDKYLMKRRKAIGKAMGKRLKEERASLSEVMTDTEDEKPIKEKKVNNKIKINPKLGEAVEELGGEILEITQVDERYKGKHGQSSAQYKDDRSSGGKMVSGDSKMSGAEYTHGRRVRAANPGSQPDEGGKTKPKSQGKMDRGTRADLEYRKANLKKEEVEQVDELYKGKHGQTEKQYADSRSDAGKMVSGDSKHSGAEYTHGRRVKAANPGMQPDVGGKTKPKSQGKMDRGTRADLEYRKANLKKKVDEAVHGGGKEANTTPRNARNARMMVAAKAGDKHMRESSFRKIQEKLNLKKTQWGV